MPEPLTQKDAFASIFGAPAPDEASISSISELLDEPTNIKDWGKGLEGMVEAILDRGDRDCVDGDAMTLSEAKLIFSVLLEVSIDHQTLYS